MNEGGIIIEGAEQQGKSTFCDKLIKILGIEAVHMHKNYGFVNGKFDYSTGYFYDIDRRSGPFIYDRSYVSELVYGKLFQRNNITPEIQANIEKRFIKLGYFLVVLELNQPWIIREETVTKEQNEKIKMIYREIYPTLTIDKFLINPTDEAVEYVAQQYKDRR